MKTIQRLFVILGLAVSGFFVVAGTAMNKREKDMPTQGIVKIANFQENELNSANGTLNAPSNFKIVPLAQGQFELILYNGQLENVSIQVYDVIGNLLLEETSDQSQILRRYNLSDSKSRLFVVKIGTAQSTVVNKVTTG